MKNGCKRILILGLIVTISTHAFAQAPAPAPADSGEAPATALEVKAEDGSGLVEPRDPEEGTSRKVARVVLFPLRGLWFVVWGPVRALAWAYDRYAIQTRVKRFFFSEDG